MAIDNKEKLSLKKEFSALSLGYTMLAAMVIFGFIGHWADSKVGGGYAWTLVGLLAGFFMGLYEAWKIAMTLNDSQNDPKKT